MNDKTCVRTQIFLLSSHRRDISRWRWLRRHRLKVAVTELLADYFLLDVKEGR